MVSNVQQTILQVVADVLECDESELSTTYSKEENDEWDSVNALRMFTIIENELEIRLDMGDFLKVENIQDIIDLVEGGIK